MANLFRTLTAGELECRIGLAKNQGVSLLLYKNSRCDMSLLDDTFGPFGWQREHRELKGVIYCGVSVKDVETGQWITKWDAGVESNTEPQKGEASDSFKRACVNWGIGRELYTAPFIWVNLSEQEWNGGKPRVNFKVSEISYSFDRKIRSVTIVDGAKNVRYQLQAKSLSPAEYKRMVEAAARDEKKEEELRSWWCDTCLPTKEMLRTFQEEVAEARGEK